MSLALVTEKRKQVRKTNQGREDEPSVFEFTSNEFYPGGEITGIYCTWVVTNPVFGLQYFHHVIGGVEYRLLQQPPVHQYVTWC